MKLTTTIEVKDFGMLTTCMKRAGLSLTKPEDATDFFFCLNMVGLYILQHPEEFPCSDFPDMMKDATRRLKEDFGGKKPYFTDFEGRELFPD